jgi:hypothetical protein
MKLLGKGEQRSNGNVRRSLKNEERINFFIIRSPLICIMNG